jgi:hypothetical protein
MTRVILDGAAAGSKLVFSDNLYAYGPAGGPMTEQTPQLAQGPKGRIRIEMALSNSRRVLDWDLCLLGVDSPRSSASSTTGLASANPKGSSLF